MGVTFALCFLLRSVNNRRDGREARPNLLQVLRFLALPGNTVTTLPCKRGNPYGGKESSKNRKAEI
jgi:hypothetical protein